VQAGVATPAVPPMQAMYAVWQAIIQAGLDTSPESTVDGIKTAKQASVKNKRVTRRSKNIFSVKK